MIRQLWLSSILLITFCLGALAFVAIRYGDGSGSLIIGAAVVIWVVACGGAFWLSRWLLRPLETIRQGAERFGRGELGRRISTPAGGDLSHLAETLNGMAAQLSERISELTEQRNEREAILASMQEGVLAIDREERLLGMNRAAEEILGVSEERARGLLVQEAVRHSELQRYVVRALHEKAGTDEEEEGALLHGRGSMVLRANSAPLRDDAGNEIGILVLFANVTRLNRLENLRRDFVANVSHELRTPAAGIKGYVETLLEGAMENPELAGRFLEVILRQTDRLNGIIEDLLSLSRLENLEEVPRERTLVRPLIEEALEVCHRVREERGAAIETRCAEDLEAFVNERLVEQALINLVDNAVKYAGPEARVRVEARAEGEDLVLEVSDNGPGISPEHQDRLFERFYRVDKARSRQLGGTGLGLSIVKHVALAHDGTIDLRSRVGQGATFFLRFPGAVAGRGESPAGERSPGTGAL